ncbi:MAG: hypothetical protein AAB636_01330 [Patescibacteria group bacterium]
MAKNLIQDMIPAKHINKIIVSDKVKDIDLDSLKLPNTKMEDWDGSKKSPRMLWFVAIISIVFLFFALSTLFASAKIGINPKMQDLVLNTNLSASKDSNIANVLPFSLISLSGEETKIILAGEEKEYKEKAKGTVVIYNNYSSSSQRLSIETRLEGSNGKIYKTTEAVVVPGITKVQNSAGVLEEKPGSVEIDIYGAEEGAEYNSSPLDFKIFGFKGNPKYSKFYARSKGDITGGIIGNLRLASEEDKTKAIDELKTILQDKLFKKATDQLPSGYILFKDAVIFKSDDQNIDISPKENDVSIKIKGTLYGFLFEEKKLTKKIVETVISDYKGDEVYIPKIKEFSFSLASQSNLYNFTDVKNISFSLTGTSKITWKIDESSLSDVLLGKTKKEFNEILEQYPNIDSADLTIRPFWRKSIPKKLKDIKIIVNTPE